MLLPAAVIVLTLTLALFFRHLAGVIVPVAVAGITVVWTMGAYAATGHATNEEHLLLVREGRRVGLNVVLTHPGDIRRYERGGTRFSAQRV